MKPLVLMLSLVFGAEEARADDVDAKAVDAKDVAAKQVDRPTVLIVVGAPGTPEYGRQFQKWADRWQRAAEHGGAKCMRVGNAPTADRPDRQRLEGLLAEEPKRSAGPLWLVLIGHGTFDGRHAKFNLRGPDVTATVLAEWLAPYKRPVVVIDGASSSAPLINRLSGPNRVVVTATKSGYEQNYARFGDFISAAVAEPAADPGSADLDSADLDSADLDSADLDKDGQTSVLEAFLWASGRVAEFYRQEARLATETALLDDNGDGLGTPAAWFRGIHATRRAKDGGSLDGSSAHQYHLIASRQERNMPPQLRARRDQLQRDVAKLRESKDQLADEDEYYEKLETLMIELARLYASLDESVAP